MFNIGGNFGIQTVSDQFETVSADEQYDYDLVVVGGGSGGLACAKEAAGFGKRVAVLDYVTPSPAGSTWGLGGTCVNVGCIPKKMMHGAALLGESFKDAAAAGWAVDTSPAHDWGKLVQAVQQHIIGLNYGYEDELRSKAVTYLNKLGSFSDEHTLLCDDPASEEKAQTITSAKFVLAVGGRPRALSCPGGELAISSDDLFSLTTAPGKTLCIGASFIALECAGFLHALGYDVTVMVRSILLRGFDREMAEKVGDHMEENGVGFIRGAVPTKLSRTEGGRILVEWEGSSAEYDTVISAIGRVPQTASLNLGSVGVETDGKGKVLAPEGGETTGNPNIFAIGDILAGGLELTPVAVQAGKLLARRLYNFSGKQMDYTNVPVTVFTPLEYGCVGLTEEQGMEKFGLALEVYQAQYAPLEWAMTASRGAERCYCKVLVDKSDDGKIVGLHILGPNAGEITQGFAVAVKAGATYENLCDTVGIHPTTAETLTKFTEKSSKSNGFSLDVGGACAT